MWLHVPSSLMLIANSCHARCELMVCLSMVSVCSLLVWGRALCAKRHSSTKGAIKKVYHWSQSVRALFSLVLVLFFAQHLPKFGSGCACFCLFYFKIKMNLLCINTHFQNIPLCTVYYILSVLKLHSLYNVMSYQPIITYLFMYLHSTFCQTKCFT